MTECDWDIVDEDHSTSKAHCLAESCPKSEQSMIWPRNDWWSWTINFTTILNPKLVGLIALHERWLWEWERDENVRDERWAELLVNFYLQQSLFILCPKVTQTSFRSSSSCHSFLLISESFALREGPPRQCSTFVTLYPYSWHWLAFLDIGLIAYPFDRTGSYGSPLDRIDLTYSSLPFVLLRVAKITDAFLFLA